MKTFATMTIVTKTNVTMTIMTFNTCSSFAWSMENGEGACWPPSSPPCPPCPCPAPPWFSFSSLRESLSLLSSSSVSPRTWFWSLAWSLLPVGVLGTFFSWFNSFWIRLKMVNGVTATGRTVVKRIAYLVERKSHLKLLRPWGSVGQVWHR